VEEYIIPDIPADPGHVALTSFFASVCDLGLSAADTVTRPLRPAPKEIIEEFLMGPGSLRMLVKFIK